MEERNEELPSVPEKEEESASPSPEQEALTDPTPPTEEESSLPDYEAMAAEDLAAIKRLDPAYAPAAHLGELPFAHRFAELRDLGLSVEEALAAAVPRFARSDNRAHLRAVSARAAKAPTGTMSREQLKEARMLFSGLSDQEINALHRRVCGKSDL